MADENCNMATSPNVQHYIMWHIKCFRGMVMIRYNYAVYKKKKAAGSVSPPHQPSLFSICCWLSVEKERARANFHQRASKECRLWDFRLRLTERLETPCRRLLWKQQVITLRLLQGSQIDTLEEDQIISDAGWDRSFRWRPHQYSIWIHKKIMLQKILTHLLHAMCSLIRKMIVLNPAISQKNEGGRI